MEVEYLPCDDGDDDCYDHNDDDCDDHDHDGDEGWYDDVAKIVIMMKFIYLSVKQTLLMPTE